MIDFVSKKKWFFVGSVIPMIIGIIFIVINGIPWGIDFTGGTEFNVESVNQDMVKARMDSLKHSEAVIQPTTGSQFTIQTKTLTADEQGAIQTSLETLGLKVSGFTADSSGTVIKFEFNSEGAVTRGALQAKLSDLGHGEATIQQAEGSMFIVKTKELTQAEQSVFTKAFGDVGWTITSLDSSSDATAGEKKTNAEIGVVIASIAMLLYIWWAFRKCSNPFSYGACAIIALLHDVFICVAFYAIFASSLNLEINLLFITGILTVIGYSVNDTVVVFDRIRENMGKGARNMSFEDLVNISLTETMTRCLLTVITTLLACAAVLLFVGDPIRNFLMVLLVGIASGAYSSIFIASMLLVVWETRKEKKVAERVAGGQKGR